MEIVSSKHSGRTLTVTSSGYKMEACPYTIGKSTNQSYELSDKIESFIEQHTLDREPVHEDEKLNPFSSDNYITRWVDIVSITPLPDHTYDPEKYTCMVVYKVSWKQETETCFDRLEKVYGEKK